MKKTIVQPIRIDDKSWAYKLWEYRWIFWAFMSIAGFPTIMFYVFKKLGYW